MPIYLSARDVASLAPPLAEVEQLIGALFERQRRGTLVSMPRTVYGNDASARFMAFPGVLPDEGCAGIKWLAMPRDGYYGASGRLSAILLVNHVRSGELPGIVDGTWITAARTACVSLFAARRLANPVSRRIAFIGCGQQAQLHLEMLRAHFPLDTVIASSRTSASVEHFLQAAAEHGLRTQLAVSNQDCVRDADIVIASASAPSTTSALCDPAQLRSGCFVAHVDLGRSFAGPARSPCRLVVDDLAQYCALVRDGKLADAQTKPEPLATLGPASTQGGAARWPIAFVPTGWGIADVVLAHRLIERAQATGAGAALPD